MIIPGARPKFRRTIPLIWTWIRVEQTLSGLNHTFSDQLRLPERRLNSVYGSLRFRHGECTSRLTSLASALSAYLPLIRMDWIGTGSGILQAAARIMKLEHGSPQAGLWRPAVDRRAALVVRWRGVCEWSSRIVIFLPSRRPGRICRALMWPTLVLA